MVDCRDKSDLMDLWKRMKRIRFVEETIARRYSEQKMRCPTHLSVGQEAVAVGVCSALITSDQAVSTHRAHAHYLAKGGNLKAMIAEIYGKATGCSAGKGGSMHLIDLSVGFLGSTAIVANSIPIAVGAALSSQMLNKELVACVFFGDAAVEEGVFHEVANFAVVRNLPVLFICENNLYSVYSPLSVRKPKDYKILKFVAGYGISVGHGDGNDVECVYSLTEKALQHIRNGKGPYFLEFSTYRWLEHCGPTYDNDIGYRTEEEFQEWKAKDPVQCSEEALLKSGQLTKQDITGVKQELIEEIDEAFTFAETSPFPDVKEMSQGVYA